VLKILVCQNILVLKNNGVKNVVPIFITHRRTKHVRLYLEIPNVKNDIQGRTRGIQIRNYRNQ